MRNMRKIAWYLKAAALLPLATWNYLKKNRKMGLLAVALILVIAVGIVGGLTARHRRNREPAPDLAQTTADQVQTLPPSSAPASTPTPTPAPSPASVTLTFAGDCTLGMDDNLGYSDSFNETFDREGPDYFLQAVKPLFEEDDLTVVNFEGPLTEETDKADKSFAFKGHAEFAGVLSAGSVEAANLANNHSHDYGDQGYLDTEEALDRAGITHFGFDDVAVVEAGGVKVGLTGLFTVYEDPQHREDLLANIQKLKDQGAQVIVACFHWGFENDYTPEGDQVALAHAAIDAGAHLVIGHHPHVVQGVEVYQGRYIVYSLGNFCFGGNYSPPDYDAMIFRQTFTIRDGEVLTDDEIQVIPCLTSSSVDQNFNDYRPVPADGEDKQRILEELRDISEGLGEINIFAEEQ